MNAVFCRKGTQIIEIFGKGFVNHDTIDLVTKIDVKHHYIISKYGKGAKDSYEGQHQHVTVDVDVLKPMVENLLQSQKQTMLY